MWSAVCRLAQARSALLASAPCAQYSVFCGGHSLRLVFGSFFYRRILAVFWLFVQTVYFSFFVVFVYAWFFGQSLFLRTLGRQFFGGTFVSKFGHGCLLGCFVCYFMV